MDVEQLKELEEWASGLKGCRITHVQYGPLAGKIALQTRRKNDVGKMDWVVLDTFDSHQEMYDRVKLGRVRTSA